MCIDPRQIVFVPKKLPGLVSTQTFQGLHFCIPKCYFTIITISMPGPLYTVLMQQKLRSISTVKQVWLADDATGAGKITNLKQWWDSSGRQ